MLKFNGKVMKFGNVWGCGHTEPVYSVIYENGNTYTSGSNLFATGQLSSSKNYIAITFHLSTSTGNADAYVAMKSATDTSKIIWLGNARNYGGYAYASIFRSSASSWNGITNPSVGSQGAVTGNVYYTPNYSASADNVYKMIFTLDSATFNCYINGDNVLNGKYTIFNPLNFSSEIGAGSGGSVSIGQMKIFECETFEEALAAAQKERRKNL